MYRITWDSETGGILLTDNVEASIDGELRPVFFEELDLLGLDQHWEYPRGDAPLLWAAGRRYYYRGEYVAETRGGGYFEKPVLSVQREGVHLTPIDVQEMVQRNQSYMEGLTFRAIEFLHAEHRKHESKVDISAVAFSGGKDSLVTLDLAQRTLVPDQFLVVFNDTTMELPSTHEAVERAQARWPDLRYVTARSHIDSAESWRLFGPPSRFHRWCCSVHKSAPTLLALRQISGNERLRAIVYEGVRNQESQLRATYGPIAKGSKHASQTNARPILSWSSAEVFLYLFERELLLNDGYRYGLSRVGCCVCPFASSWSEAILGMGYSSVISPYLEFLADFAGGNKYNGAALDYVQTGGWKRRAGGRTVRSAEQKLFEQKDKDSIDFLLVRPNEDWSEWLKSVGTVKREGKNKGRIENNSEAFQFEIRPEGKAERLMFSGLTRANRFLWQYLRSVANKSAYCVRCRSCEVDCPTGALRIEAQVHISEDICTHCHKCLTRIEMGCHVASSLQMGKLKGDGVRGLDRYCTFGLDQQWLSMYFQDPSHWWQAEKLGPKQYVGMRAWLMDAEVIDGIELTSLGQRLRTLGARSPLTWAVIWTNLSRNSALVRWFVTSTTFHREYLKGELIELMGTSLGKRTRQNAATSLFRLLRETPLGAQLGLGEVTGTHLVKRGHSEIPPLGLLYSIYRWAEEIDRYQWSVSELMSTSSNSPHSLFGMSEDYLRGTLRGLSISFQKYVHVEFVRDLDNVYLEPVRAIEDVLGLA